MSEPVSEPNSLLRRENTENFVRPAQDWRAGSAEIRVGSKAWKQIPYSSKEGVFELEQGNKLAASGYLAPISGRRCAELFRKQVGPDPERIRSP
jgi:hypothetical protein